MFDDKNETLKLLLESNDNTLFKLLPHLSRQYTRNEMILDVDWLGSDSGVYFEPSFGTDFGICDWITPNADGDNLENFNLTNNTIKGSESGTRNGLTLLLDAETFDYGMTTK